MTLSQASICPDPAEEPKCILLVEDELLIRLLLAEELRDRGHRVVEACNADEALVILTAAPPDLIITDVCMPGSMDGLELLSIVRDRFGELPVVIMSGHLEFAEAMAEGAAAFVAKPFPFEGMVGVVENALARAR